jgi:hypothetical protein
VISAVISSDATEEILHEPASAGDLLKIKPRESLPSKESSLLWGKHPGK